MTSQQRVGHRTRRRANKKLDMHTFELKMAEIDWWPFLTVSKQTATCVFFGTFTPDTAARGSVLRTHQCHQNHTLVLMMAVRKRNAFDKIYDPNRWMPFDTTPTPNRSLKVQLLLQTIKTRYWKNCDLAEGWSQPWNEQNKQMRRMHSNRMTVCARCSYVINNFVYQFQYAL